MVKGSSDRSHFIFEINVGKSRTRYRTTLDFNDKSYFYRLKSIEYAVIEIQSRSISGPTLSDINFKNKMAWVRTTLKKKIHFPYLENVIFITI